jgi:hypothetical protein
MMSQLDDDLHNDVRQAENVSYEPNGTAVITRNRTEINNAATQTFNGDLSIFTYNLLNLFRVILNGLISSFKRGKIARNYVSKVPYAILDL